MLLLISICRDLISDENESTVRKLREESDNYDANDIKHWEEIQRSSALSRFGSPMASAAIDSIFFPIILNKLGENNKVFKDDSFNLC